MVFSFKHKNVSKRSWEIVDYMKKPSFKGKVVLVTGAARGIGRVITEEFLKKGAIVVINDINKDVLAQTKKEFLKEGFSLTTVVGDLTKEADCNKIIKEIIKQYKKLDILINNAGRGFRGLFEQTPVNIFHDIMQINLNTAVNMTAAALPFIKKAKGSIIFISSVAAVRGLPSYGPYSVAKMALKSFAQLLRTELSGTKAHVGLLIVGPVEPDSGKKITTHDGKESSVRRLGILVSKEKVAKEVLLAVKKKSFVRRVNVMTHIIGFLHLCCPWLLEKILVRMKTLIITNKKFFKS